MGKIKGFLFAVRHREILMTDLGLCDKGTTNGVGDDTMAYVAVRIRTALLLRLTQMLGYEFYFAWREPLGCLLIALVE